MFNVLSNIKEAEEIIKEAKSFIENNMAIEAINILTPLLLEMPNYYEGLVARAEAYCALEKYESAIKDLDLAIKVDNFRIEAYFLRGQIKMLIEDYSPPPVVYSGSVTSLSLKSLIYSAYSVFKKNLSLVVLIKSIFKQSHKS